MVAHRLRNTALTYTNPSKISSGFRWIFFSVFVSINLEEVAMPFVRPVGTVVDLDVGREDSKKDRLFLKMFKKI